MKRQVLILIGVVIVFVLLCVWIYLLFFGGSNNTSDETFTDLGFGDTTDGTFIPGQGVGTVSDGTVDTTSPEQLRQLTTKPVLAYREVVHSTSTSPLIYYVEAGTGHIFTINHDNGKETRVSATTVPLASRAALSPNGRFVMMQSGTGVSTEYVVGSLSTSSERILTTAIDEPVDDFVIPNNTEILYGVKLQDTYVGKRYSLTTGKTSTLFTLPFREARVSWGTGSTDTHYAYPKATYQLEGFIYRIDSGRTERLPIDGHGLSAIHGADMVLHSEVESPAGAREYTTRGYVYEEGYVAPLPFPIIPEKCIPTAPDVFTCAASLDLGEKQTLPDAWYQGTEVLNDKLWDINPIRSSALLVADPSGITGRNMDIVNLVQNQTEDRIYFQDRHSGNLWVYELFQ